MRILIWASKQSGHIIPVKKSSPVLISNGAEQIVAYHTSSEFSVVAKMDGEVVEYDEDTGLMVVKYKDGSYKAIDLADRIVKNSTSGFHFVNKMTSPLKKGSKFKTNDIIACDSNFFSDDGINGNRFNIGTLEKVAIMSGYYTFEDSTAVTHKVVDDMSANITKMVDGIIGMNANVYPKVDIGDHVEVGDILIESETSYDEQGMNAFLASIGNELHEEVKSLTRVPMKSPISGTVVDIKVYASVDVEDMSPSLRQFVNKCYAKAKKKNKILDKYDDTKGVIKAGLLVNEPTGKINKNSAGQIKGREFDGVLVEYYIEYVNPLTIGNKITYFSALKCTIGDVIPKGLEPYSEFRQDEEVSAFLGQHAVLARMTPSIFSTMFGNKVLVELKRSLQEIYNS